MDLWRRASSVSGRLIHAALALAIMAGVLAVGTMFWAGP